jgi:hypothetical protein
MKNQELDPNSVGRDRPPGGPAFASLIWQISHNILPKVYCFFTIFRKFRFCRSSVRYFTPFFPFSFSYSGFNPLPSSYLRIKHRKNAKISILAPEYPATPRCSTPPLSTLNSAQTLNPEP